MGSRPPRQQGLPKKPRPPRPAAPPEEEPRGLRMETITPFIALAVFPVALGAAFIAYGATGDTRAIGSALMIAVVAAVLIWLAVRARAPWRDKARMTNELLLSLLIATIGMMFLVGGIAGLAPIWIGIGLVVIGGAWLVQRSSSSTA